MDTGYRANPEHFKMQMEVFDRMRETERKAREERTMPGYPKGVIDLRRLTARDQLSIEPGRTYR